MNKGKSEASHKGVSKFLSCGIPLNKNMGKSETFHEGASEFPLNVKSEIPFYCGKSMSSHKGVLKSSSCRNKKEISLECRRYVMDEEGMTESAFNDEPNLRWKIQKTLGEASKNGLGMGNDGVSVVTQSRSFKKLKDLSILKYLNRTPRCGSTSRLLLDDSIDDKFEPIIGEKTSHDNLVECNSIGHQLMDFSAATNSRKAR